MKTTIEKTFEVTEPIDKVWANLADPMEVVTCVPGASITEKIDEKNYKGEVETKFGPIKVKYDGEIEIETLDAEAKKMVLNGKGLDSKGKGSADMKMTGELAAIENGTKVHFTMDISIDGMLAQFGSRLIGDVSDQLLNQFIENFKSQLAGEEVDNSMNAGGMMGTIVKNKLGNIFGGKKEA